MSEQDRRTADTTELIALLRARGYVIIAYADFEQSLADGASTIIDLAKAALSATELCLNLEYAGRHEDAAHAGALSKTMSEILADATLRKRLAIVSIGSFDGQLASLFRRQGTIPLPRFDPILKSNLN